MLYSPYEIYKQMVEKLDKYDNWREWDIEAIYKELNVPEDLKDIVGAVKSLIYNTNLVSENPHAFEKICNAFNYLPIIPDAYQPLTVPEIFYALEQIKKIVKEEHNKEFVLSEHLQNYIAACAYYYGYLILPKEMDIIQDNLEKLYHFTNGTKRYNDYKHLYEGIKFIRDNITSENAKDFIKTLDDLDNSSQSNIISQLISCYLYTPLNNESNSNQ